MARRPKPWYRKSRGAWFVTLEGVQHNLGLPKNEAFERFYELMREPQQRKVPSQSLAAIIDAFLEWTEKHRAPDTYEWYRYRLQRFIERYPDLRTSELKPYHVQTWVDGYSFSSTSKRNYIRVVKRCLRWATVQGYLDKNPVADLEVPVAQHREVAIGEEEFESLLSYVRNREFEDLLVVTWETGCRPQELLRVEARHVDLKHQRWVFKTSESKGQRKSRVVYLTDTAMAVTTRLMLAHPQGALFRNSAGRPWTSDAVNCAVNGVRIR